MTWNTESFSARTGSLAGRVAVVTGAGSSGDGWNNGKAIAALLAERGATVIGLDLNEAALQATKSALLAHGCSMRCFPCDVTRADEVARVVAEILKQFGSIDVLVNNVGMSAPGDVVSMEEALWDAQFSLNVKSAFLMMKSILPSMCSRHAGSVVNISSISAFRATGKQQIAYSTSKAGLVQLTKMAAVNYGSCGVRINCVIPGLINTPLVERLARQHGDGNLDNYLKLRAAKVPLAREGTAWDVAHAVAFLASDEAQYITAADLWVDGGLSSSSP